MISEMLDNGGFNTLIFDDSYAKICLIASIISELQCKDDNDNHHKVIYLDFDAAFTSYAKAGLIPTMEIQKINDHYYQSESNILKIFLPSQDIFDIITTDIIKSMSECSLVIFDSINSFYNLFYDRLVLRQNNRLNIGSLNQLLYFVLMIILKHTSEYNIPFLVTSMIRYMGKERVTSNRLLSMKSSFNFYVKIRNLDDLSITVFKHPKLDHKNFIMKDKVLKWA
ncbi:MAG TPA: hypothetical protein VFP25_04020 [Nitrososphaeraceae archaeon]|nr:hypothetical protein [Nitrososphaeraceae archaeon]